MFTKIGLIAKSAVAVIATTISCSTLIAQETGPYSYIRLSGEHIRFDDGNSVAPSANITTVGLRGGYMFMPMAGVELRANTTAADQTWNGANGTQVGEASLDYSAAALLRFQANIDPGIAPYVVLGAGTSKLSYDLNTAGTLTETGFAGAIGVDMQLKNRITIGAEVGQFVNEAMTFGIHTGFDF